VLVTPVPKWTGGVAQAWKVQSKTHPSTNDRLRNSPPKLLEHVNVTLCSKKNKIK
jgi:hypothetical protein